MASVGERRGGGGAGAGADGFSGHNQLLSGISVPCVEAEPTPAGRQGALA